MYESVFGFRLRPFAAAPTAALYYSAASIEKARTALVRGIENDGGPGLVIGPAGVGKSLLCQLLADQFRDRFRVVMLASARLCTRRALLQNILFELGLPYRDLEEGELRLSLIDYLANNDRAAQGMLLIVDEAHSLPTRLLEEIRMITNLVRDGRPRVRLVLAGSARLEERFASPKLESFNQRISTRCYLEPWGREETKACIRSQLGVAGRRGPDLFSEDALNAVFDATGGVPRLTNQVCDHALVLAAAGGQRRIDAAIVQEAWADLQQLPAPWHGEPAAAESIVEFGRLDQAQDLAPHQPSSDAATMAMGADGADPMAQLSRIETSLAAAVDDRLSWSATLGAGDRDADEEEQFQPAGVIGPEVELVFHGPHAPFGDSFMEEEIVIDRYAALESARLAKLRQTPWSRDRQIPERLADAEAHVTATAEPETSRSAAIAVDPSSDPVLPEYGPTPTRRPAEDAERLVALSVHADEEETAPSPRRPLDLEDDRDLIVVEDDGQTNPPGPNRPTGRVRRQEYKQLFARMRRG